MRIQRHRRAVIVSVSITYMVNSGHKHRETRELAAMLFPDAVWIFKESNIYVAKSRLAEERWAPEKWRREMEQVRILTSRGSVAYFLPEGSADTVIDGEIVELKTVSGTRATLSKDFKKGYKQGAALCLQHRGLEGHSVFIRLKSDLSAASVKAKIAGELKNRFDTGKCICYFEMTGELHYWSYEELRGMIGKR